MANRTWGDATTEKAGDAEGSSYLTTLFTVIGFSLYWAVICMLLFSAAFTTTGNALVDGCLLRAFFLGGLCLAQVLSGTCLPDLLDTRPRRGVIRIAACVLLAALAFLALFDADASASSLAVRAVLWVLLGLAMGEILVFWGVVWSCIDAERSENSFCSMCVATSALAAALACAALLFAPHEACVVISVAFLICSMVLQRVCGRRIPPP